jgi:hypothetical protein
MYPTPRPTGHQPPETGLTCGNNLPSIGAPCGEPAAWHVLYGTGPNPHAALLCGTCMDQTATAHGWYQRHPAGPACASTSPIWHDDHCTTDQPKEH